MISLKKHLDDFDSQGRLIAELEDSYKSALEGFEQSLPAVSEKLVQHYRRQIRALWTRYDRDSRAEVLKEVREELREHLKGFVLQADRVLEQKDKQFKEILRSFADAAGTLAKQTTANDSRLTGFARSLESIVDLQDLNEIRKRLVKEVAELKHVMAQITDASRQSVLQLRAELSQFQEKLAHSEEIARTDPLTGVCNRRSGEQAMRAARAAGTRFSVVMLDVNGFKGINDHWGHQAGDAVLTQFASRLESAVRAADLVCRWGGDEFLVVLPGCSLDQASARSKEFSKVCEGEYRLTVLNKQISVRLRAALGVAECQPGESIDAMIYRADEALYKAKGGHHSQTRVPRYDGFQVDESGVIQSDGSAARGRRADGTSGIQAINSAHPR